METYCFNCEEIVKLSEGGYCLQCGKHYDNMHHYSILNQECNEKEGTFDDIKRKFLDVDRMSDQLLPPLEGDPD